MFLLSASAPGSSSTCRFRIEAEAENKPCSSDERFRFPFTFCSANHLYDSVLAFLRYTFLCKRDRRRKGRKDGFLPVIWEMFSNFMQVPSEKYLVKDHFMEINSKFP